MIATLLKPGDRVKLNDQGIETVSAFCNSRSDVDKMMGILTVKDAHLVEVTDDSGRLIKNYQGVDLVEFPCLLDNVDMVKVR